MSQLLLVGAGFVAIGSLFVWLGLRRRRAWRRFVRTALVTRAEVLDLRVFPADAGVTYAPLVRFRLPDGRGDGRVVEAVTMTPTSPAPARVGDVVGIRFDPEDPTRVELAGGLANGGTLGCLFGVLGSGLVLVGLAAVGVWVVLDRFVELP